MLSLIPRSSAASRRRRTAESLAALDQTLASLGFSARHRARLLVLATRRTRTSASSRRRAGSPPARSRRPPRRSGHPKPAGPPGPGPRRLADRSGRRSASDGGGSDRCTNSTVMPRSRPNGAPSRSAAARPRTPARADRPARPLAGPGPAPALNTAGPRNCPVPVNPADELALAHPEIRQVHMVRPVGARIHQDVGRLDISVH